MTTPTQPPAPFGGVSPTPGGMCAKPLCDIPMGSVQLAFMALEMGQRIPAAQHRLELTLSALVSLALSHRAVEVFGKEAVHREDVMCGISVLANRMTERALSDMEATLRLFDDGGASGDSFLDAMRGLPQPSAPGN